MGPIVNGSYECRHEDQSILRGAFDRTFCEPILKRLPSRISPNHITLLGGICVLLSDIFIFKSYFLAAAFFMFLYAICDDLDGLHAKKNGLSSKRGEFFDHWLDSIVVANNITVCVLLVGLHGILLPLLAFSVFFAYHLSIWEQKETDVFRLMTIGPLEGLMFNILFYVLAFFLYGSSAFTFQEGSVNLALIFAIMTTAGFIFMSVVPLLKVRTNLSSLLLPLAYAIVFCLSIYIAKGNIYISFVCLLLINVVLSGGVQSVRLSRRKRKVRTFLNYIILPFAVLILLPVIGTEISAIILNGICLFIGILMFSDVIFAIRHLPGTLSSPRRRGSP